MGGTTTERKVTQGFFIPFLNFSAVYTLVHTLTCPLSLPTAKWRPPEPQDLTGPAEKLTTLGSHPMAYRARTGKESELQSEGGSIPTRLVTNRGG